MALFKSTTLRPYALQLPSLLRTLSTHHGSCHCGNIKTILQTQKSPAELGARACQCSWCRMQGISHTSDPEGSVTIKIKGAFTRYRMGTGTAEFLGCATCSITPAAIWRRQDGKLVSVLRVQTLDIRDNLMAHEKVMDVNEESLEDRLARRSRNWTPTVLEEGKDPKWLKM